MYWLFKIIEIFLIATFPYLYPLHYLYGCLIDYNELGENE